MRYKKIKLSVLFLLGLGFIRVQAQEGILVSGSNISGNGGSVSYSVGQLVYKTHIGTNGSVAEGMQQPYEISVVTTIEKTTNIKLAVSVYPNPTTNYLTLSIEKFESSNLLYQLYDMNGKLLQNKKITGAKTNIDMTSIVPSTYFIKITQNNKDIKIFKIIKAQ